MASVTYPIEVYNVRTKRFRRAAWNACWENWPDRPFRIIGPPIVSEGNPERLTCGHVQGRYELMGDPRRQPGGGVHGNIMARLTGPPEGF